MRIILKDRLYRVIDNDGKEIDFSSSLTQLRKKGYAKENYPFEK